MTSGNRRPAPVHVRLRHVEWVQERMTERDWLILETVHRLRMITTHQLDRLLFADLSGRSQVVSRGRVVRRLIAWRVLTALPRRVGGAERGSAATVLALDSTGQRLLRQRQTADDSTPHAPGLPSMRTVRHAVAVAELYTSVVEQCRVSDGVALASFAAEPAAWWPNGFGSYLKPDAHLLLTNGAVRDHWWVEVDLASESVPTLKRKALTYLDFYQRGQLGPGGVMPRVLFSVPSEQRRDAVQRMIDALPEVSAGLFAVALDRQTAFVLLSTLKE